ncbi:nucleoside triphosphate pyrophosphohydrolase [Ningiella sp. W23]|uniref:nucleoside triphosphate pyrophosphohydrolase n=1 Tax=Ningiella sp. W23 TaxID=3023715 RepID=UPI0037570205
MLDKPKLSNTAELLNIMGRLRDPKTGCPWDLKQDFTSIVPYTIEEAYELADTIASGDMDDIKDELGDLLFQVVFYAQLGSEQGAFDFDEIAEAIKSKLIRRHPHVFGELKAESAERVAENWEQIKQQERQSKGLDLDSSVLANIPSGLAPVLRAEKLQHRCAKVGFDWPSASPVLEKVQEEIDEVAHELKQKEQDSARIEEEIGDLMFAVVNLSRHTGVNAEQALRKANLKFERRFRAVEKLLVNKGIQQASLDEMEAAWQQVKHSE